VIRLWDNWEDSAELGDKAAGVADDGASTDRPPGRFFRSAGR
jgi:hypothetical protein